MIVLITDPRKDDAELERIVHAACRAIPAGEFAVLLRDETRDDFGVVALAHALCKTTRDHGHFFLVKRNHLRVAYEVGASGVHREAPHLWAKDVVPRREFEKGILSAPCHSIEDFLRLEKSNVDWALVSPIFFSPNKGAPRGVEAIAETAKMRGDRASPKIFALGGVDASNAGECMRAGADGVAVIRAILDSPDPASSATALWNAVRSFTSSR